MRRTPGSDTRLAAQGRGAQLSASAGFSCTQRLLPKWVTRGLTRGNSAAHRLQARGSAPLRLRSAAIAARVPAPQWLSGRPTTSPTHEAERTPRPDVRRGVFVLGARWCLARSKGKGGELTPSRDRDALDLDLPGRVHEAADDQRARRAAIAKRGAAAFARCGEVAMVRQDRGDLDEIVQGHAGGLEMRFEILPGESALFDDIGGDSAVYPLADLAPDIEGAGRARNLDRLRIGGDGRRGVRGR